MTGAQEEKAEPEVTGVRDVPASGSQTASSGRYHEGRLIVDKYRLVRKLGSGGMGTVWVAHNTVLDVHVAVKLIELTGTDDAEALAQRLLEEARSAARLGHAAIVRVHDFGQTKLGDPFIAMELLDGEDLAHLLSREARMDPVQAVQLLLPIAHALSTAHEKGIIHRDVKPENIFLARDDEVALQPKLLDFGIARMIDRPRKLTVDGLAVGTPDYMSPEQARGEETTAQTDVWAFSVVLYELLMGRCPFDGQNYNALLRSIIEDAPRPISEDGIAEDALWAILSRGLEKAPVERWSSMRSLGEALALWLQDHAITEDITGTSLRRAWLKEESVVSPHPALSVRSSESAALHASGSINSAIRARAAAPTAPMTTSQAKPSRAWSPTSSSRPTRPASVRWAARATGIWPTAASRSSPAQHWITV
jgi:serine/threonine-protein kinase